MGERIEDRNIVEMIELGTPAEMKGNPPRTNKVELTVAGARSELRNIIHGRGDDRLAVVVGPCSIHDPEAALDYAGKLCGLAPRVADRFLLVMRTYFEKPRTTVGWKGLINDPDLDGSCDIGRGLQMARGLLLAINELGVPCATEFLDPVTPQYVGDLISWAAIGARTTESQTHREMASGLSMPVGFKNGTDGGLQVALNAMISAGNPHSFLGIGHDGVTKVVKTGGNPDRHIVLRGGASGPNHGAGDIARAVALVAGEGIRRPIMVDCSHGNSGKDHARQSGVARDVVETVVAGEDRVGGLMVESNLLPGKQAWTRGAELAYGVSITDACVGWEETEDLLEELACRLRDGDERPVRAVAAG